MIFICVSIIVIIAVVAGVRIPGGEIGLRLRKDVGPRADAEPAQTATGRTRRRWRDIKRDRGRLGGSELLCAHGWEGEILGQGAREPLSPVRHVVRGVQLTRIERICDGRFV